MDPNMVQRWIDSAFASQGMRTPSDMIQAMDICIHWISAGKIASLDAFVVTLSPKKEDPLDLKIIRNGQETKLIDELEKGNNIFDNIPWHNIQGSEKAKKMFAEMVNNAEPISKNAEPISKNAKDIATAMVNNA